MKNLTSSNGKNNNNNCTAFMLAKMNGKRLPQRGFSRFLVEVRAKSNGHNFRSAKHYQWLLENFAKHHFSGNAIEKLFNADVPWLLTKMWKHSELIEKSIGKNKDDYNDQRSAIRAFIDCILHSNGFDIAQFTWRDAEDIYLAYKNKRRAA